MCVCLCVYLCVVPAGLLEKWAPGPHSQVWPCERAGRRGCLSESRHTLPPAADTVGQEEAGSEDLYGPQEYTYRII